MDERDIFDEEYDRISGSHSDFNSAYDNWSNYNTKPQQPKQNKSLRIVLTAVLMVFCLVFGWALGSLDTSTTSTDDIRKDVLNSAIDFMDYNFYEDIDEATWQKAVEQAGAVLLQYAGDQFTFLMSPQTYYNYMHGTSTSTTVGLNPNEVFGMSFSVDSKGLLVSAVTTDSASYGRLQEDDLIVKITDILEYKVENGYIKYNTISGIPYTVAAEDDYVFEGKTQAEISQYLQYVYSATFHVLRDGKIETIELKRNAYGINLESTTQKRYDFTYVEYYFGDDVTNISIEKQNGAATNTKDERKLGELPTDVGYIHLTQFEDEAYAEMQTALQLFSQSDCTKLILDLKGNPGGSVNAAVEIAGLFINPDNLSESDLKKVTTDVKKVTGKTTVYGSGYLITTLTDRNGYNQSFKVESSYHNYFEEKDDGDQKRIIVWTDGGSASASEMLTGTLLDYGTAVHMGTKTYGKGIAQTITELDITGTYTDVYGNVYTDGNWAVYYTFAKYYSPLGNNIHGVGYIPNKDYTASSYVDLMKIANDYWN